MSRAGRVLLDGTPVGMLTEAGPWRDARLSFSYDSAWLEREDATPLCAVVPLIPGPQHSPAVDAFFENLLPEGCTLEAAACSKRLAPGDLFGLLLRLGRDCIGAVEVLPCGVPSHAPRPTEAPERGGLQQRPRTTSPKAEHGASHPLLPPVHVDLRVADVRALAISSLDHTVLPGAQRKLPIALSSERRSARATPARGRYILKPQSVAPLVPENEFVTLRIAAAAGVDVAACGLATLADGSLALLTRRFDRDDDGRKLRVNDFCQLAGRRPGEKFDGSAESCADFIRRDTTEPLVEVARLFRRFVVAWWTGNGHLHLKNLSLLTGHDGVTRLSPAYDLLCTELWGEDAGLALPVNGKRDGLCRADWLRLADSCGLRRPAAERVLREVSGALGAAVNTIASSPLPERAKITYSNLLRTRARTLER